MKSHVCISVGLHSQLNSYFRGAVGGWRLGAGMGLILVRQNRSNNRWERVMTGARQEEKKKRKKDKSGWRLTQVSADGGKLH